MAKSFDQNPDNPINHEPLPVDEWTEIVDIAANRMNIVALRADGSVLVAGRLSHQEVEPPVVENTDSPAGVACSPFCAMVWDDAGNADITGISMSYDVSSVASTVGVVAMDGGDRFVMALSDNGTVDIRGELEPEPIGYDAFSMYAIMRGTVIHGNTGGGSYQLPDSFDAVLEKYTIGHGAFATEVTDNPIPIGQMVYAINEKSRGIRIGFLRIPWEEG